MNLARDELKHRIIFLTHFFEKELIFLWKFMVMNNIIYKFNIIIDNYNLI